MFLQNINLMVVARFEIKFKHEMIKRKINASVSNILKLKSLLSNVLINMSEGQNQPLLAATLDRNGPRIDNLRRTRYFNNRAWRKKIVNSISAEWLLSKHAFWRTVINGMVYPLSITRRMKSLAPRVCNQKLK